MWLVHEQNVHVLVTLTRKPMWLVHLQKAHVVWYTNKESSDLYTNKDPT